MGGRGLSLADRARCRARHLLKLFRSLLRYEKNIIFSKACSNNVLIVHFTKKHNYHNLYTYCDDFMVDLLHEARNGNQHGGRICCGL